MAKKKDTLKDNYSLGKWKGLTQYKCNLCKFDTLHEKEIRLHIIDRHTPKPPPPKVKVNLVNPKGEEIKKEEQI